MKKPVLNSTENWSTIKLQLNELSRNYNVNLELIEKTTNIQELLEAILDEYILRLDELPAVDLKELHNQNTVDVKKEKLKSLIMFATQAAILKEKAEFYKKLNDKNRELSVKNKKLTSLNDHYLSMISFVSHELRSPLVSILGFAQLLIDNILGELNDDQRDAVNIIIRVSKSLIDMVKNYLDLAKIETGQLKLKMKKEFVNILEQIIEPVLREMEGQFAQKQMKAVSLQNNIDLTLNIDRELMKIVFTNLFTNAVRYGKQKTEITYCLAKRKGYCIFSIKNLGIGVKKEKLIKIFNKFTQVREPGQRNLQRSTGLGLFITKTIVEEHGGKIWAESKYGEWFQVHFTIPYNSSSVRIENRQIHTVLNSEDNVTMALE